MGKDCGLAMKTASQKSCEFLIAEAFARTHIPRMVAPVTKQGLLIPRRMLRGVKRVEIRRGKSRLTVFPAEQTDPIKQLGSKPVACGHSDASANHDQYLYHGKA